MTPSKAAPSPSSAPKPNKEPYCAALDNSSAPDLTGQRDDALALFTLIHVMNCALDDSVAWHLSVYINFGSNLHILS